MTVQDQLSAAHLAEADRLISDLAALLDAGLVVAHEHVLGPARYGLTYGEGCEPAQAFEPLGEGCGWGRDDSRPAA